MPEFVNNHRIQIKLAERYWEGACIPGVVRIVDHHVEFVDGGAVPDHAKHPGVDDVVPAYIVEAVEELRSRTAIVQRRAACRRAGVHVLER